MKEGGRGTVRCVSSLMPNFTKLPEQPAVMISHVISAKRSLLVLLGLLCRRIAALLALAVR